MSLPPTKTVAAGGSGAMFDAIAERYDLLNRLLSLGMDKGWRRRAVRALSLPPRARVLDLATGTADLAVAVARRHRDAEVIGIDPSPRMRRLGEEKCDRLRLGSRVHLLLGDAQALPFADESFDAVTIGFGIRNIPDRPRAIAEMARVTRPGGRVAILELAEPRRGLACVLARPYVRHVVPRLGSLFTGGHAYRYLQESMRAFPPAPEFAAQLDRGGLAVVRVTTLGFGACHLFVATPKKESA